MIKIKCTLLIVALAGVSFAEAEIDAFYEKKSTWKKTAIATFQNLHQLDAELHADAIKNRGVELVYQVAGPFQATEKDKLNIEDKGETVSVMGKDYPWQVLEDFKPRDGNDLAQMAGLNKGDCAVFSVVFSGHGKSSINVPYNLEFGYFVSAANLHTASLKQVETLTPFRHPYFTEKYRSMYTRVGYRGQTQKIYSPVKVSDDGTCIVSVYPHWQGVISGNGGSLPHRGLTSIFCSRMAEDFPDLKSRLEMKMEFEDAIWDSAPGSTGNEYAQSWFSGRGEEFLAWHYNHSVNRILAEVPERAESLWPENAALLKKHLTRVKAMPHATYGQALERFYLAKYTELLVRSEEKLKRALLAVSNQINTFGNDYPEGPKNLEVLETEKKDLSASLSELKGHASAASLVPSLGKLILDVDALCDQVLLDNPLLRHPLIMTQGDIDLTSNWVSMDRYGNEIVTLSPARPDGRVERVYQADQPINSMDLDWDAEKLLVCDNKTIVEVPVHGFGDPRLIKRSNEFIHDACRLPSGRIVFSSTTVEQAVPCTGAANVGNLHVMDADGSNERRLCFDQDHNWHPTVLEDGRIMYLRWEYTSVPHYFSRIVMTMNPDGTGQVSRYGSNSYWPNSVFWPLPIPGQPSKFIGIVSGHHGVAKQGHLYLFDSAKGTFEADGVVQKIGEREQKTEPVIKDRLVDGEYPHFISPHPLGRNAQEGGKYFLATGKLTADDQWGLYLLDIYDNRTLIKKGDFANARPLIKRERPPIIPERIDLSRKTANVLISDVYFGPGLEGLKRGTVKAMRVATPIYRYAGNGDTYASSLEGGWDIKKILGTVPVEADGSASFEVPANTPVFLQPLNAEGQAMQVMRSWFTAMPGENVSCIGCHESKEMAPLATGRAAMRRAPSPLEPWYGEARTFSFKREVQPVLDRKCVGCHEGAKKKTLSGMDLPDFRASGKTEDKKYSQAYVDLQKYVRRYGYESDYHIAQPTEWMADTSHLVKMLKKGHYNVQLNLEEWQRIYTWIDLNIPYPGNWNESHQPPSGERVAKRMKYLKKYAGIDYEIEKDRPLPGPVAFVKPSAAPPREAAPSLEGWPIDSETAKQMQAECGLAPKEIALDDSINIELVPIPAGRFVMGGGSGFVDEPERVAMIDQPFYMSRTEVSYAQYQVFNAEHENGFIQDRKKDRSARGIFNINQPDLPVVRVSRNEAEAFCQWLSGKTGMKVSLPTETQWEWAARAGSGGAHYLDPDEQAAGYNIADARNMKWNHGRFQEGHHDGEPWVAEVDRFTPNAWGLYNMLGNVAEWTDSAYEPLPDIGVTDEARGQIQYSTVRGGSWNDTAPYASLSSRWRYMPSQPVYDVGFRVVLQP